RHRSEPGGFVWTRIRYAASEVSLLRRHPANGRWLGFSPGMGAALAGALGALLGRPRLIVAGALALGLQVAPPTGELPPPLRPARGVVGRASQRRLPPLPGRARRGRRARAGARARPGPSPQAAVAAGAGRRRADPRSPRLAAAATAPRTARVRRGVDARRRSL